jgi:hypothetical protein
MVNKYENPSANFLINPEANTRKKSMQKSVSEVFKEADGAKTKAEKIAVLQANYKPAMLTILQSVFDPNVIWAMVEGDFVAIGPNDTAKTYFEYKPTDYLDVEGRLYQEASKLYLFMEGGNPNLTVERRMQLFVQVLESVTRSDAEMLASFSQKRMPFKSITPALINEAYGTQFPTTKEEKNVQNVQEKVKA